MKRFKGKFWLVILAAFALRVLPLRWHSFHPDEALYSWWASQIASGEDPLLLSAWVDKPPFFLYILAISFKLFGVSEASARFTGVFAGTLSVALTKACLRALYGEKVSVIGAILLAFLPFPVLFSPTALTDPWLLVMMVGSMWMACRLDNPSLTSFLAGLGAGLALGTKQQGLFFAPFSLFIASWRKKEGFPRFFWLLGFLIPLAFVEWWDALRWADRPSFWERSLITYGGLGFIQWHELGPRFLEWLELMSWIAGGPIPALALTLPLLQTKTLQARFNQALKGFVTWWFLIHWLFNFQTWDRYVLPLAPFLVALWGQGLAESSRRNWNFLAVLVALSFGVSSLRPEGLIVGSNYSLYDGVEEVAHYLKGNAKPGDIVYHHHLGWHLHFYLYRTGLEIRWYSSPEDLVKDLEARSSGEKLLAFTPFEEEKPVLQALEQWGYSAEKLAEIHRIKGHPFRIYRISPGFSQKE